MKSHQAMEAGQMTELLGGAFAPLTYLTGFLEVGLDVLSAAYVEWITRNYKSVNFTQIAQEDLGDALMRLEPLSTPARRTLLLSTTSRWTAYFDSGLRGPDPLTPVLHFSRQLACRGVIATSVPHTLKSETGSARGTYGAVSFELLGPRDTGFLNYERSVGVGFEGGRWSFSEYGDLQPFEDATQYRNRRIRTRFTPEMLQSYCEALGIRLMDEDFYCGPGLISIIHDPLPPGAKELSLHEARRELELE